MLYLYCYLFTINAAGLLLMLVDKLKSIKNKWRIPERTLFIVALLGGSLGCMMGMRLFRHKTLKIRFWLGLPLMLCAHIILLILLHTSVLS